MGGTRVTFDVRESRGTSAQLRVTGAELSLATFGPGTTLLAMGSAKELTVQFFGRYLSSARARPLPAFEPFARIKVQAELVGTPGKPSARFLPESTIEYDAAHTPEDPRARGLDITYSPDTFVNAPSAPGATRLILPVETDDAPEARHFELGIALLVDGAEEAPVAVNDILDVPLFPLRVGLVLEWLEELAAEAPPGLTLVAKQGNVSRMLRFSEGTPSNGRLHFVFRGILGPAPVDLTAHFDGRAVPLWEGQDITRRDKPPEWKETLERAIQYTPTNTSGAPFRGEGTIENVVSASTGDFVRGELTT